MKTPAERSVSSTDCRCCGYRTARYLWVIIVYERAQAPAADPEKTKAGIKRSSMGQKSSNTSKKSKVTNNYPLMRALFVDYI